MFRLTDTRVAAEAKPTKFDLLRAAWQRLFGYDFFISYAWADARPYAETLAAALQSRAHGYRCFIDQKEMGGGEAWRSAVRKALARSSVLVLVASPRALGSDNVFEEISTYVNRNRPIVPISFDNSVGSLAASHRLYSSLEERLRVDEIDGTDRLVRGSPSESVLKFLSTSFGFVRVSRIRTVILSSAVILFGGLLAAATVAFFAERAARTNAEAQILWQPLELSSNTLRPIEVDIVWKLAKAPARVQEKFIDLMLSSDLLADRFFSNPEPIVRALAGWSEARAQHIASNHVLPALTTDVSLRRWRAAAMLGLALEWDDARFHKRIVQRIVAAKPDDAYRLNRVTDRWIAFLVRGPSAATDATPSLIEAISRIERPSDLRVLAMALASQRVHLSASQVVNARKVLVRALDRPFASQRARAYDIEDLAAGLGALSGGIANAEAEAAKQFLLAFIPRTIDPVDNRPNVSEIRAVAEGIVALPIELTAAEFIELVRSIMRSIYPEMEDREETERRLQVLRALAGKVKRQEAGPAAWSTIRLLDRPRTDEIRTVAETTGALDAALGAREIDAMVDALVDAIQVGRGLPFVLPEAMQGLPMEVSWDQAQRLARAIIAALHRHRDNIDLMWALGKLLNAIATKTTTEGRPELAKLLAAQMHQESYPYLLGVLGEALGALDIGRQGAEFSTAASILMQALGAGNDVHTMESLGKGLGALRVALSAEQARTVSAGLVGMILQTNDPNQLQNIDAGLAASGIRLTEEDGRKVIAHHLTLARSEKDPASLVRLVRIMRSSKIEIRDVEQRRTISRFLLAALRTADAGKFSQALALDGKENEPLGVAPSDVAEDADAWGRLAQAVLAKASNPSVAIPFIPFFLNPSAKDMPPVRSRIVDAVTYPTLPPAARDRLIAASAAQLHVSPPLGTVPAAWVRATFSSREIPYPPQDPCASRREDIALCTAF
jgi:hypothetical protein